MTTGESPLGIIAGKGSLPGYLIDACLGKGREVFVLALKGETNPSIVDGVPHTFIQMGEIGAAIDALNAAGVKQLVMAGRVERPSLKRLKPDAKGAKLLAKLGASFLSGDNRLLSIVIKFLEDEGFQVLSVEEVLGSALVQEGPVGSLLPDRQAEEDISLGMKAARAIGALDIGQAAIVQNGYVLGLEAAEGTDGLIERCARLKAEESGGVLVKAKKPGQERRADLPAIGPQTVHNVASAGLSGIAVEAGHSLILDPESVACEADRLGVFVIGVRVE